MEDLLESLVLPGLVVCIVVGTIILARLDAKSQREIDAAQGGDGADPTGEKPRRGPPKEVGRIRIVRRR